MKTKVLPILLLLVFFATASGQGIAPVKNRIFSFTPLPDSVDNVNGIAFGLGHFSFTDKVKKQKVNGLNLEVNPLTPLLLIFQDPDKASNDSITLVHNGLHLSVGGFNGGVAHKGLGISVYSVGMSSKGLTVTAAYNLTKELNGVHITGLANSAINARGLLMAASNHAEDFKGVKIGLLNKSTISKGLDIGMVNTSGMRMDGVQIGLVNIGHIHKGLQIGLWNINNKRSLPFINW